MSEVVTATIERPIRHVPVVDGDEVVGTVTEAAAVSFVRSCVPMYR